MKFGRAPTTLRILIFPHSLLTRTGDVLQRHQHLARQLHSVEQGRSFQTFCLKFLEQSSIPADFDEQTAQFGAILRFKRDAYTRFFDNFRQR